MSKLKRLSVCYFVIAVAAIGWLGRGHADAPDFGRDVRPILAKHCYKCHGPDPNTREADLRLDMADAAMEDRGGYAAVVPGDPEASELLVRITSEDADLRMPPSEPLSASEINTLRQWVAAGGAYEVHWAFVPPQKPAVPAVENDDWCQTPIDQFVLHQMQAEGLSPSPRGSRTTLIRRLYLDLCGISPTPEQVEDFVSDSDPNAYGKLVEHLLSTPEYAERFARPWLDLARYSDTNGYEKDRPRSIWPFRDWVIQAISDDMPFDQFTIEQLGRRHASERDQCSTNRYGISSQHDAERRRRHRSPRVSLLRAG